MKISCVMPTYDRGNIIGRSIRSVMSQDRPPEELIVIDDGSSDNTREVVESLQREFATIRYLYRDNPLFVNPSVPLNVGIRQAKYELIMFTLSDTVHLGNTVAKMEAQHEQDPNLYLIGSTIYWVQKDVVIPEGYWEDPIKITNMPCVIEWAPNLICGDDQIACQHDVYTSNIASCRKSHLLKVGGFDEDLTLAYGFEDSEITQRLLNFYKKAPPEVGWDFRLVRDNSIQGIHQYHERPPAYAMALQQTQLQMVKQKSTSKVANQGKDWGRL